MSDATTNADAPVMQMRDVTAVAMQNPDVVVAEHVDWSVNRGDYWVIAGFQGSGKSDFLMLAGGLMSPKSGEYLFLGESMPVYEDSRLSVRLRLGLAFDSGQLLSRLTIRENVALPLQYHHNASESDVDAEVMRILETMELGRFANQLPGTLARSWQKRAGLARSLALKPEVLLVDNPLGGLDLRHNNWWLNFLEQLSKGHPLLDNKPVTLVVASTALLPWKGSARQFALLSNKRLQVVGDWTQLESAGEHPLREMLTEQMQNG